jgi:hypothetical protein
MVRTAAASAAAAAGAAAIKKSKKNIKTEAVNGSDGKENYKKAQGIFFYQVHA